MPGWAFICDRGIVEFAIDECFSVGNGTLAMKWETIERVIRQGRARVFLLGESLHKEQWYAVPIALG